MPGSVPAALPAGDGLRTNCQGIKGEYLHGTQPEGKGTGPAAQADGGDGGAAPVNACYCQLKLRVPIFRDYYLNIFPAHE